MKIILKYEINIRHLFINAFLIYGIYIECIKINYMLHNYQLFKPGKISHILFTVQWLKITLLLVCRYYKSLISNALI